MIISPNFNLGIYYDNLSLSYKLHTPIKVKNKKNGLDK